MLLRHFDADKDYGFLVLLLVKFVTHGKSNKYKQRSIFLLADRPGSSFIAKDRPVVVLPLDEFICSFIAQDIQIIYTNQFFVINIMLA